MKNFRKLKLLFTPLLICGLSSLLHAQSQNQEELSDIFSKFDAYDSQYTQPAKVNSSGFSFTKAYSTSYGAEANRPWNNTNPESDVFMARLTYTNSNPNLSYQASVSTGGALYSYRNNNGECIPKQRGAGSNIQADGTYYNQWTESVWHMVGNNTEWQGSPANGTGLDKIIFHQGGAYGNIPETGYKPNYGFQLADHYDSALQEYSTVAWLQIGHPKATRDSDFYTEILIWTKYRNIGNGILQVDQALYNFGDDSTGAPSNDFRTPVLNRINAPYTCNNDETHNRLYMSSSNGTYAEKTGQGWGTSTNNTSTDGWVAFIAGNDQSNSGAGYGFIFDKGAGSNKFGYVNASKAQNNFTSIRTDTDIYQGDLVNYRYFITVGNNVNAIQSTASTYENHTRHELRNMPKSAADDASYYFQKSGNTITASNATGASQGLDLKLQPYENSFPVFIVTNSSGVSQVTSDLYSAVRAANSNEMWPWNGVTEDIKLLGFSDNRITVNNFETVTVNSGSSYTFPDGTTINNITSDLYKVSFTGTNSTSTPNAVYRQYTQTHVQVSGNPGGGSDNLALNGTASQSDTLNGRGPELAIDGNTNGNYSAGSVTVAAGPTAWWEVDLGGSYSIDDINVFNRTNSCCIDRLSNFTVQVKDSNGNVTFSETITTAPNPSETVDAGGAVGQIVRIQSNITSNLNLAEVEVYGEPATTTNAFVPDPNKTYYIDCPQWNLRLAASGESEDAYTTTTSTTGADVEWKFVSNGNGYWHLDRAAGGTKPRLRTDGTADADMNQTAANGTNTYYSFSEGNSNGTYLLTIPDGTVDYNRLQIDNTGAVKMVGTSSTGSWVSFTITETAPVSCASFSRIQAENYNSMSGVVDEGINIGFIENGDWAMYSNVDLTCANSIDVRASSNTSGGNVQVRLGSPTGTLIGTVPVSNTGGWGTYTTVGSTVSSVSGTHDVYLVFTGGSGYLFNLNWVEFDGTSSKSSSSEKELSNAESDITNSLTIYPNPVNNKLKVSYRGTKSAKLEVMNLSGQRVLSQDIKGLNTAIDVSNLASGVYILRVTDAKYVLTKKIIKK